MKIGFNLFLNRFKIDFLRITFEFLTFIQNFEQLLASRLKFDYIGFSKLFQYDVMDIFNAINIYRILLRSRISNALANRLEKTVHPNPALGLKESSFSRKIVVRTKRAAFCCLFPQSGTVFFLPSLLLRPPGRPPSHECFLFGKIERRFMDQPEKKHSKFLSWINCLSHSIFTPH